MPRWPDARVHLRRRPRVGSSHEASSRSCVAPGIAGASDLQLFQTYQTPRVEPHEPQGKYTVNSTHTQQHTHVVTENQESPLASNSAWSAPSGERIGNNRRQARPMRPAGESVGRLGFNAG